ncbi:MAG: serine/threonine-protein phosphatase [Clostridia bacterium]|nr:serine/threonine-protein phosphatase [Clostridia bacterium]
MRIDYNLFTDVGGRRVNEDSVRCAVREDAAVFVLCDGLGGHGKGEIASSVVADFIIQQFNCCDDYESFVQDVLEKAQEQLLAKQVELRAQSEMKTTATLLLICGNSYKYAYIGDSRIYCFRNNKVLSRTLDHSVPQMLVLAGEIKEKQIRKHPDRNRLLRVMGVEWEERRYVVSETEQLKVGDAFLLCSDGFWEPINEKQMCKFLKHASSAGNWTEQMAVQIRKNSDIREMDNFSAVAVIVNK